MYTCASSHHDHPLKPGEIGLVSVTVLCRRENWGQSWKCWWGSIQMVSPEQNLSVRTWLQILCWYHSQPMWCRLTVCMALIRLYTGFIKVLSRKVGPRDPTSCLSSSPEELLLNNLDNFFFLSDKQDGLSYPVSLNSKSLKSFGNNIVWI